MRSDIFYGSQLTIRNLQILTGCRELNAVAGGEYLLLLAKYGDSRLPTQIVGCLFSTRPHNGPLRHIRRDEPPALATGSRFQQPSDLGLAPDCLAPLELSQYAAR